jgi:hypothetical protein
MIISCAQIDMQTVLKKCIYSGFHALLATGKDMEPAGLA